MEKVQQVISEIHEKVGRLKSSLDRVESENETLKEELNVLKGKLEITEREAAEFREKYDAVKDQVNDSSVPKKGIEDEEIDLLVREIDDCINRLKQQ